MAGALALVSAPTWALIWCWIGCTSRLGYMRCRLGSRVGHTVGSGVESTPLSPIQVILASLREHQRVERIAVDIQRSS